MSEKQTIHQGVNELRGLVALLKSTKSPEVAMELSFKRRDFSVFTRTLWEKYKINTIPIKYSCDAIIEPVGHAAFQVSRAWYAHAILAPYEGWMHKIDSDSGAMMRDSTRGLISAFAYQLRGPLKKVCDGLDSEIEYSDLNSQQKKIVDMFVDTGCKALDALYVDWEKELLSKLP